MIPISKPIIARNAKKYVLDCLKTGWISSKGPYIEKFEKAFLGFVGTKYAIATNSGTSALHLGLAALDIGQGDEVIVPSLTMIAAALPVVYLGAEMVLVDVEEETGNIDVTKIEAKITPKTKAIVVVHNNGHPADMREIISIAKKHHLYIIEDAAESHGAETLTTEARWQSVGSIGDVGCFSLYANKIVSSGEGGMVTTNSKALMRRIRSLQNLARTPGRHFYHQEIGFTYRMSNIQGALGLAQLEKVETFFRKKQHIAKLYLKSLANLEDITLPIQRDYAHRLYWQFEILMKNNSGSKRRDRLARYLSQSGIETRCFFTPLHEQPAFIKLGLFKNEHYPVAEKLSLSGIYLPSGPDIKDSEVKRVCSLLIDFFKKNPSGD